LYKIYLMGKWRNWYTR